MSTVIPCVLTTPSHHHRSQGCSLQRCYGRATAAAPGGQCATASCLDGMAAHYAAFLRSRWLARAAVHAHKHAGCAHARTRCADCGHANDYSSMQTFPQLLRQVGRAAGRGAIQTLVQQHEEARLACWVRSTRRYATSAHCTVEEIMGTATRSARWRP
jgi:hypothetical protein